MRERVAWTFIGTVLGAIGGWLAHAFLRRPLGDEERPPIIVRGGSIEFETEKGWTEAGHEWKPDHFEGKPVEEFIVYIKRSGVTGCSGRTLRGTIVRFQHVQPFMVIITGEEPRVTPRGLLERDRTLKRVKFNAGSGPLGEIRVNPGNHRDWVTEDEEVCICFRYADGTEGCTEHLG